MHDALRVIEVTKHFNVPSRLVINKYDLNPDMSGKIEEHCEKNGISLIGKVRFDKTVVESMVEGKTIMEYKNTAVKDEIHEIWRKLQV